MRLKLRHRVQRGPTPATPALRPFHNQGTETRSADAFLGRSDPCARSCGFRRWMAGYFARRVAVRSGDADDQDVAVGSSLFYPGRQVPEYGQKGREMPGTDLFGRLLQHVRDDGYNVVIADTDQGPTGLPAEHFVVAASDGALFRVQVERMAEPAVDGVLE